MSTDGYFREKLGNGVGCLVGLGDIKSRVRNAFFAMPTVSPQGFSNPELGAAWSDIYARITRETAVATEGTINATLEKMTDEDAAEIARDLVELYSKLLREAKDPYA
ncbi:hypothetical protein [Agrobacterium rosae]|uniref:hypothetical protein n=1 Tax=Agrobacterium rosae TaxID=1972867 RepID=UPI002033EE7C|nr:hypothetical protein [Agrobacterium rosae]MCM2435361.1 hypothetical protein [Agrobacterium rosae]